MLPTPGDVHVDVPLTNVSTAYVQADTNFIADQAVPIVPVAKQSDKWWSFTKGYWRRSQMQKRQPGSPAKRLDYGVDSSNTYFADIWSLAKDIPDEVRRNADAGLDQDRVAVKILVQQAKISKEKQFVASYFLTGKWGTDKTVTTQWSSDSSTPLEDVAAGKKAVLLATGMEPMHMAIGYDVWLYLKNHPEIVDRIKYGQTGPGPAKVTVQAVAALMELDALYVAKASEQTENEGGTEADSMIVGKHALLYYRPDEPALEIPSAMYQYAWTGYTGAGPYGQRILRYRQPEMYHSDSIEIEQAYDMKRVATDCGYYFPSVVA